MPPVCRIRQCGRSRRSRRDRPTHTDIELASVSRPACSTTVSPTSITAFNATPEPVRKGAKIKLSGVLNHWSGKWTPYRGKIQLYFKATRAATWTQVGATTTGTQGRFTHTTKAVRDGSWRACFAGQGHHKAVCGPADHVDVR